MSFALFSEIFSATIEIPIPRASEVKWAASDIIAMLLAKSPPQTSTATKIIVIKTTQISFRKALLLFYCYYNLFRSKSGKGVSSDYKSIIFVDRMGLSSSVEVVMIIGAGVFLFKIINSLLISASACSTIIYGLLFYY